ncbi:diacylglycerol kinase family protein [Salinivibrio sp. ES.052]|uniref:diacylglycerol kinase family protein n=1 Tax=Salinivibrio sp. ES.052 TaxID=1882823 RepID=UPI000926871B|nr:diacylglycerol kinase family protein [Salinivibrio sp. ES.052]SIO36116.1 Diacylglycerol kinase family enzyme [Salinivibrio sp. ES.052]
MLIGPLYSVVAICLTIAGWLASNVFLTLLLTWSAAAFLAVSVAYWRNQPRLFRKRQTGQLPRLIQYFFAPFFACSHLYNRWARQRDTMPPVQQVAAGLYVGARLTDRDIPDLHARGIKGILDVTAEFESLNRFTQSHTISYLSVPVLDHAYPSRSQLMRALQWLHHQRQHHRDVVIHCALGRGRSVMVTAAYLWALSPSKQLDDVLNDIKAIRPKAHLNRRQRRALLRFQQEGTLRLERPIAWIIANPAAGGKKWRKYSDYIQTYLSEGYRLVVHQTRHNRRSYQLACRAISQHADIVIAAGGDGTINAVARALINTATPLGILPLGTANALCHALWGIKTKLLNIDAACDVILDGSPRIIDTARCNGKTVLLVVGIGFEQQMIRHAARAQKNQFGQWAYLQGLLGAVSRNQTIDLRVSFEDQAPQPIRTTSMVIANAAPMTTLLAQGRGQPNYIDGHLDVTWLTPSMSKADTALSLAELALASLFETRLGRFTHYQQATHVSLHASRPIDYVIDGELYHDRKLDIRAQPQSLSILSPPWADDDESDDKS